MTINVVSVRVGDKYSPDYVDKLHDQIARNLSAIEHRHWCLTDDPASLPEGVEPIAHNPDLPGWWQKLYLFSAHMPWAEGERVLYMDLDSVITGRLEDLAERKGIFIDKYWPMMFSSAVMVWDHGEHRRAWEGFTPDMMTAPGPFPELYPKSSPNGGDQEALTALDPDWAILPPEWARSYVDAAVWPPEGCKVVMFHGEKNKPHLIAADSWVHDVWKVGGLTALPEMSGMNVARERALANVAANITRDVDWFTGCPEHRQTLVLVCGGPSMRDSLQDIRDHKRRGAKIATVNNAMRFLLDHGVKPDHHIILDARPENVAFLADAPEGIRYFLASQCDPSLFDALKHRDVILWHNGIGDGDEIATLCEGIEKSCLIVPGGCTVGLRACWLAYGSGYRRLHVYGMDSSYEGEAHHAYPQALNDADAVIEVAVGGRAYRCAKWMARQANDFKVMYPQITEAGMQMWVHGRGLIPDMWRAMRRGREAA